MNEPIDLKQLERQAFLSFHQAYYTRIRRFVIYGILIGLLYGWSYFWMLPLYLALLVTGGLSSLIGLVIAIRFLHRYPKAQSTEEMVISNG